MKILTATLLSFFLTLETGQNEKNYIFNSTLFTWSDAQDYCRTHYTDLATVESAQENQEASEANLIGNYIWIGLYRVPWTWSDNHPSLFRNWVSGQPNSYNANQHCGCEDSVHGWHDEDCIREQAFICHEGECFQYYVNLIFNLYLCFIIMKIFDLWLYIYYMQMSMN